MAMCFLESLCCLLLSTLRLNLPEVQNLQLSLVVSVVTKRVLGCEVVAEKSRLLT